MRIGLIGCGRWGKYILRDLVALGCDVTVVARSTASRERASSGGAAQIVSHVADLDGVTGIVVATPTSTHAAVVAESLTFGVPVFVEKPLTDDPTRARALVERAAGRLFVMDKWRYHRGIEALGGLARSGQHGALRAIHTRRLSWSHDHDDVDAVWILIPHDLAIVREIAGLVPAAVSAVGSIRSMKLGTLTSVLGPDPVCTIEVSTLSPIRERRVTVEFDNAVALLDDAYASALRVVTKDTGHETTIPLPSDMPLQRELEAFLDHLRGGPAPRSSGLEGAETVERIAQLRGMAGI